MEDGPEHRAIIEPIIEHIKSDTKLEELNNEAAEEMAEDEETVSVEDLQKDVSLFIEIREDLYPEYMARLLTDQENNNLGGSGSYGGNNRGGHSGGRRKFLKKLN